MTTEKARGLTRWTFASKLMALLFNMLCRLVIAFLQRSKCLLISWPHSPSTVILEPKKISLSLFPHLFAMNWWAWMPWTMGPDAMILVFWKLSFKPTFSLSYFTFTNRFLFAFCHKGGVICLSEVIDIFPGNLDSCLCFIQPGTSHDVLSK